MMVMRPCCVPDCNNKTTRRYCFPLEIRIQKIWVERINNKKLFDYEGLYLSRGFQVCGEHFDNICKDNAGRLLKYGLPTLKLPNFHEPSTEETCFSRPQENVSATPPILKTFLEKLSTWENSPRLVDPLTPSGKSPFLSGIKRSKPARTFGSSQATGQPPVDVETTPSTSGTAEKSISQQVSDSADSLPIPGPPVVRSCSVPNCSSRSRERTVPEGFTFSTPKEPELLRKWNDALRPLLKRQLSSKDRICASHFRPADIVHSLKILKPDGTVNRVPRECPGLRPGAVPISGEQRSEIPEADMVTIEKHQQRSEDTFNVEVNLDPPVVLSDSDGDMSDANIVVEREEERVNIGTTETPPHQEYGISQLMGDLKTKCLPEFWSYARCGSSVLFHLLDPFSLTTKLRLIIDEEMKFTAALPDGTATMDIDGRYTSMEDIVKTLEATTYVKVCVGTEVKEQSRHVDCPGFLYTGTVYKRRYGFQRCLPCRVLRNRLKTKNNHSRSPLKRLHGSSLGG